jgi:hypothetical protein
MHEVAEDMHLRTNVELHVEGGGLASVTTVQ